MKIFYSVNGQGRYIDVTIQKKKDLSEFVFKKKRDDRKIGKRNYPIYFTDVDHAIEILFQSLISQLSIRDAADFHMKRMKVDNVENLKIKYINDYYNIELSK